MREQSWLYGGSRNLRAGLELWATIAVNCLVGLDIPTSHNSTAWPGRKMGPFFYRRRPIPSSGFFAGHIEHAHLACYGLSYKAKCDSGCKMRPSDVAKPARSRSLSKHRAAASESFDFVHFLTGQLNTCFRRVMISLPSRQGANPPASYTLTNRL